MSWGAKGSRRCQSSLIDLIARHDLVNRFRLDHPSKEVWTWLKSSPSIRARSYLDRDRRADADFVICPTFHYIRQTGHRLVRLICG